jgi:hypothetical protein
VQTISSACSNIIRTVVVSIRVTYRQANVVAASLTKLADNQIAIRSLDGQAMVVYCVLADCSGAVIHAVATG